MVLMSSDDLIGLYSEKPFSKYRRNISLLLDENKRKHTIHTLLELDVTDARKKIRQLKQKQNIDISFTGWIIKCVAQGVSEHKIFNSYRHGKRKIITFDDIDVPIPVERYINDDVRPMAYILRKANRKTLQEITAEIRSIQQKAIEEKTQLLSEKLSFLLNKENRLRMGESAREVARHQTWESRVDQVAELYEQFAKRGLTR